MYPDFRFRPFIIVPTATSVLTWVAACSLLLSPVVDCSAKLGIYDDAKPELNQAYNLTCKLESELLEPSLWWAKNNVNLTENTAKDQGLVLYKWQRDKAQFLTLEFTNLQLSHFSQYICHSNEENGISRAKFVSVDFPPEIDLSVTEDTLLGAEVNVTCKVTGYPLHGDLSWRFKDQELQNSSFLTITHGISNITQRESIITIHNVSDAHNGSYMCQFDGVEPREIYVLVNGPPVITFDVIKPVGKDQIFLNWTLNNRNSKLEDLTLVFKKGNGEESKVTGIQRTKYVLKDLQPKTLYKAFTIFGKNKYGNASSTRNDDVWTRSEDPKFLPTIQVKGTSPTSVSLGWNTPSSTEDFQYYKIRIRDLDNPNSEDRIESAYGNDYIAARLESRTLYGFQVQACSEYTETCGERSNQLNITTMDGTSSEPTNVTCRVEDSSTITLTWDKPVKARGQITAYEVTLKGSAEYTNHEGNAITEELQPIRKSVLVNKPTKIEFNNQPPNTNFSLSVCAVTNSKQCGENGFAACSTPVAPPSPEELNKKVTWSTYKDSLGRILFRMNLSPISQRNGTICCLRVIIVRIPKDKKVDKLLSPLLMFDKITSYEQVHNNSDTEGAYVAEVFDANRLSGWKSRQSIRVSIGDEEPTLGPNAPTQSSCHAACAGGDRQGIDGLYREKLHFTPGSFDVIKRHRKRNIDNKKLLHMSPRDGPLDSGSTYTAYVVAHTVVKRDSRNAEIVKSTSKYLPALNPKEQFVGMTSTDAESVGVMVIGVLIVMLLAVFVALMCVMRWRKKEPADQEYGISGWAQQCWRRLGGQRLLPSITQPNRPPIPKDQLVAAYTERHENGDAGFQREFDHLPDHFNDRSTDASQKNIAKNRYPDIRAYDQTRVKLSTADGASDYINANIVVGYKERKKFICAQGPMETTIADWWRMVWEQRVHMIIMLTNIEEYNKQKCAKYWPSAEEPQEYGNVAVTNASEKKFSDYLLRTLKLKLVGTEGEASKDERVVEQYHYLVWKDYSAPEYPIGIIRFVKRINEVYSLEKGPILVHCSAGVGRTGTLVALDSLLQQLTEEKQVSVYNTIWDLRHHRNFLVQSLKQYIFIYRALMEFALFGDTEVPVKDIKPTLEKLKAIPDGKTVTTLEEEFERLTQVVEDRKAITIGASEENKHRNRHENVIPYDGNRVILSPTPGPNKEVCMYINASFIEGYDSTDRYIIAQDPLDVTVGDFWRMIHEHNIRSIVMMSELSEGKCPRYWPEKDQETNHGYIRVKYMQSQSCPFYYKREFNITNTKGDESCLVTQFHYNGWPEGESEVPESTRGIVELVDKVFKHKESLDKSYGATLVHCSAGTDRSCIFVALAILIQQMAKENRIDVFSTVRKLRSQRQGLFQNLAQYEFLYRSLDTYADLHVSNGNAPHGL